MRPKQGHHVLHKRWYKGGLLGTTTTCKVRVADMTKQTVTARGPDPLFTEPLEFLLGECSQLAAAAHRCIAQLLYHVSGASTSGCRGVKTEA